MTFSEVGPELIVLFGLKVGDNCSVNSMMTFLFKEFIGHVLYIIHYTSNIALRSTLSFKCGIWNGQPRPRPVDMNVAIMIAMTTT